MRYKAKEGNGASKCDISRYETGGFFAQQKAYGVGSGQTSPTGDVGRWWLVIDAVILCGQAQKSTRRPTRNADTNVSSAMLQVQR